MASPGGVGGGGHAPFTESLEFIQNVPLEVSRNLNLGCWWRNLATAHGLFLAMSQLAAQLIMYGLWYLSTADAPGTSPCA